jgi:uncharacterized membrane protein
MEILIIIGIFLLITILLPWINRSSISNIKSDLEDIRAELSQIRAKLGVESMPVPQRIAYEQIPAVEERIEQIQAKMPLPELVWQEPAESTPEASPEYPYEKVEAKEPSGIEFDFGAKLPVWIGAVSLIFAGFFLMKYSFEAGLLGPLTRIILGGVSGAVMMIAGYIVMLRPNMANKERIAQGLCGAGIVTLYVCLYAAVNLYALITPITAFIGMAAVTAASVFLSLRIGQPIAVFGLIGGLLTPALVGSTDSNNTILFIYLFALFAGMMTITARRGWWVLSAVSVLGIFGWTGLWALTSFNPDDALEMILLQAGVTALTLVCTKNSLWEERDTDARATGMNILAIAGTSISVLLLSLFVEMTAFDWTIMGLLSLATVMLAYFRPDQYRLALLCKVALDFVLFATWVDTAPLNISMIVLGGLFVLYGAIPHIMARKTYNGGFWTNLQVGSLIAGYGIAYLLMPVSSQLVDYGLWGIVSAMLAGYSIYSIAYFKARIDENDINHDVRIVSHALAVTSFISIALITELPKEYLPLAFALQILAACGIYTKFRLEILNQIVLVLTAAFAFLEQEQINLFGKIIFNSIFLSPYALGNAPIDVMILLGTPAAVFAAALYMRHRGHDENPLIQQVLFGTSLMLTLGVLYYGLHSMVLMNVYPLFHQAGFIERGYTSFMIVAVAVMILMYLPGRYHVWGRALFHIFTARLAYFDLVFLNPYFNGTQLVGDIPLLNGITMTYLGGFAIILAALRHNIFQMGVLLRKTYSAIALVLLMVFVSLTVRHFYHGENMTSFVMDNIELYTYSIVWLLTSILLFTYGVMKDNKDIRFASLCFMVLTVCKVFLVDAAELEGLYRVFSFFGLGVSLIGISYFYARFVSGTREALYEQK